ncbi:hypothetical protein KY308_01620, partial [Candidatus Woesearchaeota archaeon]|nr:hypothetical protein [Candidatus Woesearchaeota archaeon]
FIYFPLMIIILGGIITYLLILKFIQQKSVALIFSLLWMSFFIFSPPTPSTYSPAILWPLFLLSTFYIDSKHGKFFTALCYGLTGLGHVAEFLGASLFLAIFFCYKIYTNKDTKDRWAIFKNFLIVGIIGVLIAMLYWWAPLFVYHGHTPNNWQEYTYLGLKGFNLGFVASSLKNVFFNTSSVPKFLFSILALCGILFFSRKKYSLGVIVFITAFLGVIHPAITQPLFGTTFGYYRFPELLRPVILLGGSITVVALNNTFKNKKNASKVIFALLILLIAWSCISTYDTYMNDMWTKVGLASDSSISEFFSISNIIIKTTDVNSVFITKHVESGFALNALTGRKVMAMRVTHASPYVEQNKRIADEAIILYGNDSSKIKSLIEEYHVKYFYTDSYAEQSEANCIKLWDNLSNPMYGDYSYSCFRVSPEYADYLKENGLQFEKVTARLDVASDLAPKFELLAIKPSNLSSYFIEHAKLISQNNVAAFYALS